jgi:hypothetical protein
MKNNTMVIGISFIFLALGILALNTLNTSANTQGVFNFLTGLLAVLGVLIVFVNIRGGEPEETDSEKFLRTQKEFASLLEKPKDIPDYYQMTLGETHGVYGAVVEAYVDTFHSREKLLREQGFTELKPEFGIRPAKRETF